MSTARVTVSLPSEVLASVERTRRRLHKSRSAVIGEALAEWLRGQHVSDADREYARGYLKHPEKADRADEAVAEGAVAAWDRWE
jgi:metal-responsive CopG/Arc/MetJ family transcriptional regulator